jgi:hypothetical protein
MPWKTSAFWFGVVFGVLGTLAAIGRPVAAGQFNYARQGNGMDLTYHIVPNINVACVTYGQSISCVPR